MIRILIQSFTLQIGHLYIDIVLDVIMLDESARNLIDEDNLGDIKTNIFRLKQIQDDPTLLFWRPWLIEEGEEN